MYKRPYNNECHILTIQTQITIVYTLSYRDMRPLSDPVSWKFGFILWARKVRDRGI